MDKSIIAARRGREQPAWKWTQDIKDILRLEVESAWGKGTDKKKKLRIIFFVAYDKNMLLTACYVKMMRTNTGYHIKTYTTYVA